MTKRFSKKITICIFPTKKSVARDNALFVAMLPISRQITQHHS